MPACGVDGNIVRCGVEGGGGRGRLAQGGTGLFCHGDQVGMADICLVPQVYNARRWEVDVTSQVQICRIVAELEAIPAIAAAHPDKVKPS